MVEPGALTLGTTVAALTAEAAVRPPHEASALARLVGAMRQRFASNADEQATNALTLVERMPESTPEVRALAALIDERSAWDTRLRTDLARLVALARDEGVDVNAIMQVVGGQIAEEISLRSAQATVTYKRPPPPPGRPGH